MKFSCIVFESKERAVFKTEEKDVVLSGNQVRVRVDFSAISAGTELANYHALPNTAANAYQGMHVTGDSLFPIYPGYSSSGHVEAIGPEVKNLKVGDRVIPQWCGHCSVFIRPETQMVMIPDRVESIDASFTQITAFPMLGVRKLKIELGESVMVAGLGVLGLFAIQFARLSGAYPVLACDFSAERRALALKLGADYVFDPRETDFIEKVKAVTGGQGPNNVVEVTGYISALQQALEYIAWEGRITLLGCTRVSDATIDYYKYIHKRGITIIGCHTATRPKVDSQPGKWTEFDDFHTFLKFVDAGRIQVKPLITKVVSPRDAGAVYHEIGFSKNPPFGVVFDWRDIEK
ncbi:MAG: zinc-binding alcohol dehydrogenase [Lentisphaeria bacterium]